MESQSSNAHVSGPARVVIQPNGQEYIVMVNGSAFLALTLAEAEAIVTRLRGRSGEVME
jgi:hypothetical protein